MDSSWDQSPITARRHQSESTEAVFCITCAAVEKDEKATPSTAIPSQLGAGAGTSPPDAPVANVRKKPAQRAPRKKPATKINDKEVDVEEEEVNHEEEEEEEASKKAGPVGRGGKASRIQGRKKKKNSEGEDPTENGDKDSKEAGDLSDDGGVWGPHEVEEEVDLDASVGYNFTESMEPPAELLMPLLPYQKQFLAWCEKRECFLMY